MSIISQKKKKEEEAKLPLKLDGVSIQLLIQLLMIRRSSS